MTLSKTALSLALAASMASSALIGTGTANAAPFAAPMIQHSANADTVQHVWYRGGWRGGFWAGPAILGGLFVGGVLVAAAINEHRASDGALRRCDRDFRGFDYRRGTYIDRSGQERVCPYLY